MCKQSKHKMNTQHVRFYPYDDMKLIPIERRVSRMECFHEWDAFGKMARETGLATPDTLDDCIRDTDEWLARREKKMPRQQKKKK